MAPKITFIKSVKMINIIGGFSHGPRKADDGPRGDSETEPLCGQGGVLHRHGSGARAPWKLDDHKDINHLHSRGGTSPFWKVDHHRYDTDLQFGGRVGDCPPPKDIRHGYLGVYVGKERKRYVISTHYLSHRLFKALLNRSEREFGFAYQGGLPIMCEPVLFEHLLWLIGTNDPAARTGDLDLDELLEFYEDPQHE